MGADAGIGSLGVKLSLDAAEFGAGLDRTAALSQREMARIERANKSAAKEVDRLEGVVKRQIDTFGLSGTALLRYDAQMKGAADRVGPLIDKLEALKKAAAAEKSQTTAADQIQSKFAGLATFIGGLGIAAAITSQFDGVRESIDKLDALDDLSEKFGVSAEKLGAYTYASEVAGTTTEAFSAGIGKLSKTMGDAAGGVKEAKAAFDAIGVSVTDASGKLRDGDEVLLDIAEKFAGYEDSAAKAALAQALFGKSGADMIPFLNKGRDGIKELTDEARKLGIVIGNDAAKAAGDFGDNVKRLSLSVDALKTSLASSVLPSLLTFTNLLVEARKAYGGFLPALDIVNTNPFKSTNENLAGVVSKYRTVREEIEKINAQPTVSEFDKRQVERLKKELELLDKREKFLRNFQATQENGGRGIVNPGDNPEAAKPAAPVIDKSSGGGAKGPQDDPAKNLRDNDLRDQERYIAAERDLAQQRNRFLDLYNSQGLISIQGYYDAKRAILDAATTSTIAAYDRQIAALRDSQAKEAKATDRAADQGKINDLLDKREKALRDAGSTGIEFAVQQQAAEEALRRSIAGVSAEVLQLQQRLGEAAAIRFDATNAPQLKSLRANQAPEVQAANPALAAEAAAGEARLRALREYTIAQARYTEQSTEATRVTEGLAIAEARIALSEKLGATSTLSALQQVGAARQAAVAQMEAIVAAEEAIARASGNPALVSQAEKARLALEQLRGSADVVGERFKTIFDTAGADAFADFITGSKTASQAFSSFANSILRDLSRIAAQQITSGLTGQGGLFSQLFSAAVSYYTGSTVPRGDGTGLTGDFSRFDRRQALGGAWDRGVQTFARGDVFGRPTAFAYGASQLGVMGEAGPEAIMPLKRGSDGKLGVAAQGVRGGDTHIVIENHGAEVKTQESRRPDGSKEIRFLIRATKQEMIRDVRAGGELADAFQGTFGVSRAAGVMRGA